MTEFIEINQPTTDAALWDGFRDFISKPYANNPQQLSVLQKWYDDLRIRNDIRLEYARIKDQRSDRVLEAYVLNRQIIFSNDKAVLTVPYPRSTQDDSNSIHNDQLVGAWLHDFSSDKAFVELAGRQARETRDLPKDYIETSVSQLEPTLKPHLEEILDGIKGIEDPSLPGGAANTVQDGVLRFLGGDARAQSVHRDNRPTPNADDLPHVWSRQFLHPIIGAGTIYALDGNEVHAEQDPMPVVLGMPPGITYAHTAYTHGAKNAELIEGFANWGIRHGAPSDPGPRAALLKEVKHYMWEPVRNEPSPWVIAYQSPSAELEFQAQPSRPTFESSDTALHLRK